MRDQLVSDVVASISDGVSVALVGEGGMGKTAVARAALELLVGEHGMREVRLLPAPHIRHIPLGIFRVLTVASSGATPTTGDVLASIMGDGDVGQTVVLIEDVQDVDATSLAVIADLIRWSGLRAIVTGRPVGAPPELASLLRQDMLRRFDVLALSDDDAAALVREEARPHPVEEATIARILDVAEGSPLLVTQLMRSLRAHGAMPLVRGARTWTGPVPSDGVLADIMRAELDELSCEAYDTLELVAFAEPLGATALHATAASADIAEVLARGLVRVEPRPSGGTRYVIASHLMAEVIRVGIDDRRRAELLARVHDALLVDVASLDVDALVKVAWAATLTDRQPPRSVLEAGLEATDDILDVSARGTVLDACVRSPHFSPQERAGFRLQMVTVAIELQRGAAAAAETAAAADDIAMMPDGHAKTLLEAWHQFTVALVSVRSGGAPEQSMREVHAARSMLPGLDPEDRASIGVGIAELLLRRGGLADALEMLDDLVIESPSVGASSDVVRIRETCRTLLGANGGRGQEGQLAVLQALEAEGRGLASEDGWAAATTVGTQVLVGHVGLARTWFDTRLAAEHDSLDPHEMAFAEGIIMQAEGSWQSSVDPLRSACARLDVLDRTGIQRLSLVRLALSLTVLGRVDEATEVLVEAAAHANDTNGAIEPMVRLTLLEIDLITRPVGAADAAWRLADEMRAQGIRLIEARAMIVASIADPASITTEIVDVYLGLHEVIDSPLLEAGLRLMEARQAKDVVGVDVAVRELARCGVWIPDRTGAVLTAREREVAVMAGLGFSNKVIGKRLGCTTRTVESHLGRVFAKLGVISRDDLTDALGYLR